MIDDETLQERREQTVKWYERYKDYIANGRVEYDPAGSETFSAAAYALYDGDVQQARYLFGEAATFRAAADYLLLVRQRIRYFERTEAGVTAGILSGNRRIRETMADVARTQRATS